jgi:hypothetical protein
VARRRLDAAASSNQNSTVLEACCLRVGRRLKYCSMFHLHLLALTLANEAASCSEEAEEDLLLRSLKVFVGMSAVAAQEEEADTVFHTQRLGRNSQIGLPMLGYLCWSRDIFSKRKIGESFVVTKPITESLAH